MIPAHPTAPRSARLATAASFTTARGLVVGMALMALGSGIPGSATAQERTAQDWAQERSSAPQLGQERGQERASVLEWAQERGSVADGVFRAQIELARQTVETTPAGVRAVPGIELVTSIDIPDPVTTTAPEPGTLALLGIPAALLAVGLARRRRR